MKQHICVCTETNTSWQILSLVNASGGRVVLLYPSPPVSKRKCFRKMFWNQKEEHQVRKQYNHRSLQKAASFNAHHQTSIERVKLGNRKRNRKTGLKSQTTKLQYPEEKT